MITIVWWNLLIITLQQVLINVEVVGCWECLLTHFPPSSVFQTGLKELEKTEFIKLQCKYTKYHEIPVTIQNFMNCLVSAILYAAENFLGIIYSFIFFSCHSLIIVVYDTSLVIIPLQQRKSSWPYPLTKVSDSMTEHD